ncbi:triose-phosphate isomerase [Gemella sp. zg-1178]|uniref:triose-phosphate isomerase n=1 Tax=Gemella sp. zg-1178 TaxID=2840372 RepID=UPI00207B7EAC|nr:triose-phosphate isomerase [Gemella sp. zg-1178]
MTRLPFIAGNWKMNLTVKEAREFAKEVADKIPATDKVEAAICAPSTHLETLVSLTENSNLNIGAENCHFEKSGAFTGEISPLTLADLGVKYVILGHSERREYFFESDELINKKAKAAFEHGLVPIVCCGETLEQYEASQAVDVITKQLKVDIAGLEKDQAEKLVIAYEPIWAIGTGKSATKEDAQKMCKAVRDVVADIYGQDVADKVRIQYGGSVNPTNIAEYMACPDVDGALVGGASLKVDSFVALLEGGKLA